MDGMRRKIKKFAVVIKKMNAETMRRAKQMKKIEKKRFNDKKITIQTTEMIGPKKNREKVKMQKK